MVPYLAPTAGMTDGHDNLFQILWRGRWLILLSTVLAVAAAYVYLRIAPPKYVSVSRILVEKRGLQPIQDFVALGAASTNYLQTQASMITSYQIVAEAHNDPNLLVLPDDRLRGLQKSLSATVGKNTDIITVAAESTDPQDAATMVNAVVHAYITWHERNKQTSTEELLKYLNGQLAEKYNELDVKRTQRRDLEQTRDARTVLATERVKLLEQEYTAARQKTLRLESYYQGLTQFEKDPEAFRQYVNLQQPSTAMGAEDGELTGLKNELQNTRSQLRQIKITVPLSRATLLQDKITDLEKRIAELDKEFVQKHMSQTKALLDRAIEEEKKLKPMYEKEFATVQSASRQDSDYALVVSQCEMLEKFYNSLLGQIQAIPPDMRFEGLSIHVLEKAFPATEPSSPQMARTLGIGLVLGLMLGAGLSFVRDWRDQRVRSADEIMAMLGVPVLGTVPSVRRRGRAARARSLQLVPNGHGSEAYRAVRTALFFGVPHDKGRTILVTSPGPLEGKTTIVSNLGMAMAHAGQRTLIVDADLRKPMQHRVFAMNEHGQGLIDVVAGIATLEQAIRPTEIQGLDVLASSQTAPNPSELLQSQAFADALEQLKGKYDRILVDSPPIGILADAQILAARCDLTLLVLRANRSMRQITQRAREALLTVGARVVGVVVNDVSRRDSRYSRYSGYGHYYDHNGSNDHKATPKKLPADIVLRSGKGDLAPARTPIEKALDNLLGDEATFTKGRRE